MTPSKKTPIFASGKDLDRIENDKTLSALRRNCGRLRHLTAASRRSGPVRNQADGGALDEALEALQEAVENVLQALDGVGSGEAD